MTLQRKFVRLAVNKGFQVKRIPYREVMGFVKFWRDKANSNFGRLMELRESETRVNSVKYCAILEYLF